MSVQLPQEFEIVTCEIAYRNHQTKTRLKFSFTTVEKKSLAVITPRW